MKKVFLASVALIILCTSICVFASAEDYTISFDTPKSVFKDVPVSVDVKLIGNDAPPKEKVRVKVDVSGPATPKLMATDSEENEWDIAQIGYWGPQTGFAVGGTFTNTTPVTATFSEAGLYEIKISLIDLTDGSTITSSNSDLYVYKDQAELDEILAAQNNVNTTNVMNNVVSNEPTEIPQTGPSFSQYLLYGAILTVMIAVAYGIIRSYRIHQI